MKNIVFILTFLSVLSCKGQSKSEKDNVSQKTTLKIEKQDTIIDIVLIKKYLSGNDYTKDMSLVKNIELSLPLTYKGLVNNGFIPILNKEFKKKVKDIFELDLTSEKWCTKFSNYGKFIGYSNDPHPKMDNGVLAESEDFLIVEKYNFITGYLFLEGISEIKNNDIKIKLPQYVISRNKYLFNDDQSQFSWLINNDSEFMRSLVTYFGYTEDKKLLKWVIDNTDLDFYTLRANGLLNFNEFGSLFWNKNCDGKLKLHPNTFKMLQELYKPNDNSTMRFLLEYIAGYLEYLLDKDNYKGILTEEDKVKIGANLVYFAEQYKYNPEFKDSNRMMGRFRYFTSEDYDGVIKNNSYYNLPKFREWWDKAEYDEDFVRECEYDGTCGRDNPEPDPNNPKYKNSF